MKKIIWMLLILCFSLFTDAQIPNIEWGPAYKEKTEEGKSFYSKKMLGVTDSYYYLVATRKKKRYLLQFNFENHLVQSIPINLNFNGEELTPSELINTSEGDFLISSHFDKKSKSTSYYYCRLEKDGSTSNNANLLFTHPYLRDKLIGQKQKSQKDSDISGMILSSDSTKVLFYKTESRYDFNKRKGGDFFNVAVFDEEMSLLWKRRIEFPYTDVELEMDKMSISDEGRVYALGCVKTEKKRKSNLPKRDFVLFEVSEEGANELDRMSFKDDYPLDATLNLHPDGSIYIIGSYTYESRRASQILNLAFTGQKTPWEHHGVFFAKYTEGGEKIFSKTYPWKPTVTEKQKRIEHLSFNHAFINFETEQITVLAESKYAKVDNDGKPVMFYSNYVILSCFNFNGELDWMTFIEKDFESNVSYPTSFLFAHKNDNIYLIFNDKKNRKERRKLNAPKSLLLIYYFTDITRVNKRGEIELRETLFNSKELKYYFHVDDSAFIKNGHVLIAGQGIKNLQPDYQFGRIVLP